MLVHASCVAIDGNAILLRGPSGSGKSDLSLRLIDGGAVLVADDQVQLDTVGMETGSRGLMASAPAALAGLLEVRGIGIVGLNFLASAPVRLVIDLDTAAVERLPDSDTCALLGISLPRLILDPFEPSAPAKVRIGLRHRGSRRDARRPTPEDGKC